MHVAFVDGGDPSVLHRGVRKGDVQVKRRMTASDTMATRMITTGDLRRDSFSGALEKDFGRGGRVDIGANDMRF